MGCHSDPYVVKKDDQFKRQSLSEKSPYCPPPTPTPLPIPLCSIHSAASLHRDNVIAINRILGSEYSSVVRTPDS